MVIQKPTRASIVTTLALTLFWIDLIYQVGAQWSLYPQYSYGWAVPILVGYFLWRRWQKRPQPARVISIFPASIFIFFFAAGFFLARFVQEANLIWRLPIWLMAFAVVGMTLTAIYLAGGSAWLRYFSFPILFFLVAVPWLRPIEEPFIQRLTQFNAKAAVEICSWMGVPVFQQGNVIETSKGLVGIDEACSGLRSFQATLMLSLLFGELYFLTAKRRAQLVLAGIALAIGSNILRTTTLVLVCAQQGLKAMEKWHDPTGVAILVLCFMGLWSLGWRFAAKKNTSDILSANDGAPVEKILSQPVNESSTNHLPQFLGAFLALGLIASEIATEFWYRTHQRIFSKNSLWEIHFPENKNEFREFEISHVTSDRLKFDQGHALGWIDGNAHKWQMLYFRWAPAHSRDQRIAVQDGKNHVPESCLLASGKKIVLDNGVKLLQAGGISLPFRAYVFEDRGERMHVYFCLWQDYFARLHHADYEKYLTASPRLAAIALGNRSSGEGLQILELAVWGINDDQEAKNAAEKELQQWVKPTGNAAMLSSMGRTAR